MKDTEIAGQAVIGCIQNARQFLNSSKALIQSGHYRESYLLSLYAGEELGKVLLVINYPCYTESEERIRTWKKRFLDHTEKFWFLRNIEEIERGIIPTDVHKDDIKQKDLRLEVCYVDYRDGNFINPRDVTQEEAVTLYERMLITLHAMEERHPSVEEAVSAADFLKKLPRDYSVLFEVLKDNGFKTGL